MDNELYENQVHNKSHTANLLTQGLQQKVSAVNVDYFQHHLPLQSQTSHVASIPMTVMVD